MSRSFRRRQSIIAIPSTTSKGISHIVSQLQPGVSVVTTRAHVRYVITGYGVAHPGKISGTGHRPLLISPTGSSRSIGKERF
nr:acetyl-CoA hydrolase/transferase C-terminal domain-containing protein [Chitinophaga polysaccharea]